MFESPLYVLVQGTPEQSVECASKIRKFNGMQEDEQLRLQLKTQAAEARYQTDLAEKSESSKTSVWKNPFFGIFSSSTLVYQIFTLCFIFGIFLAVFFGANINMDAMGPASIAWNGIAASLTQMISTMTMGVVLHLLSRKQWMILLQIVTLTSAGLLILTGLTERSTWREYSEWFLASWIINPVQNSSFIPLCHYICELFPVELRGTANSMANFFGTVLAMGSVFISAFAKSLGLHPIIGSCSIGIISLPLTFFLRETV